MRSYREKFAEWDALSANLKPLLAEMPYLEDEHQQFEAMVTEGRALSQRQQREAAALRETIRKRQTLEQQAHRLGASLVALVRCKLGPNNRRLADLGIQPRKTRRPKGSAGAK